jgi:hypothetical protein
MGNHPNSMKNLKPWPKGVSGNPKGRPRRKTLSEWLQELSVEIPRGSEMCTEEAIARALIARAKRGSAAHIDIYAERKDGKVKDTVELIDKRAALERMAERDPAELANRLKQLQERLGRYAGPNRGDNRRDSRGRGARRK